MVAAMVVLRAVSMAERSERTLDVWRAVGSVAEMVAWLADR